MNRQTRLKPKRELSSPKKGEIIGLHKAGYSVRKIEFITGVPKSTAQDTIKKWKTTGIVRNSAHRTKRGRPKKLTERDLRRLFRIVTEHNFASLAEIKEKFEEALETAISVRTLRRYLHDIGLFSRVAVVKPLVKKEHRKKRLGWCKNLLDWGPEDFSQVIWSDESRFKIFQSDGPQRVWRIDGRRYDVKNTRPSVKFGGGSIMVWACFSVNGGLGPIVRVPDTLNRWGYIEILENFLLPHLVDVFDHQMYFFQDDNASVHTAGEVQTWLEENDINILQNWPPQSPDLSPIENLWHEVERQIKKKKYQPKNGDDLWRIVEEEWKKIPREKYVNLVFSMPRRIRDCIKNRGYSTKY